MGGELSGKGLFALYDCAGGSIRCSPELIREFAVDGGLLESMEGTQRRNLEHLLETLTRSDEPRFESCTLTLRSRSASAVPCYVGLACTEPRRQIMLTVLPEPGQGSWDGWIERRVTGILTWDAFLHQLDKVLTSRNPGGAVIYFDIQHFRLINSLFGTAEGDRLLRYISEKLMGLLGRSGFACRMSADRFACFMRGDRADAEALLDKLFEALAAFRLPADILCDAGVCLVSPPCPGAAAVVDCAVMAQNRVKGSGTCRVGWYTDALREQLLGEQEIIGGMRSALRARQFQVCYQPQYDHATGALTGAEALVRWVHPIKGLIPPAQFIPVLESNGIISQLDMYVFDSVCGFQRRCLDRGLDPVPVSVNLTRYDLSDPGFLPRLETVRAGYGVPARCLRIEITESSALGGARLLSEALERLHGWGYTVEMDDFGSGLSALNVLKDLDFDRVKLDVRAFEQEDRAGRSGALLDGMVRLLRGLDLPVIAEGVETAGQAELMRSAGCGTMQGFLYARPMPEEEFEALLRGAADGPAPDGENHPT